VVYGGNMRLGGGKVAAKHMESSKCPPLKCGGPFFCQVTRM
jgi:hypothetical protein